MSTNKTQLQTNNETLGSILSNVLGLPSQESLKHGAYVWKKYEPNPDHIKLSFTQLNEGSTPTQIQVTSDSVDVSTLSTDYFKGKTVNRSDGVSSLQFTSATSVKYSSSTTTYSFDPSTGIITIQIEFNAIISWADYDNGVEPYTFLNFTVSDSPTAYPDGGEQGGYWYEKVSEITPEIFGGTKVAVDEITFSKTNAYRQAINHSLGEIPKFVLLSRKNLYSELPSFVNTITTCVAYSPSASGSATLKIYVNDGTTNFALTYNVVMIQDETAIKINDNSGFWLQGTYFLITVA